MEHQTIAIRTESLERVLRLMISCVPAETAQDMHDELAQAWINEHVTGHVTSNPHVTEPMNTCDFIHEVTQRLAIILPEVG